MADISIMTFGAKHQEIPADLPTFDCRALPNPYSNPRLKNLDGRNWKVQDCVMGGWESEGIYQEARHQALTEKQIAFYCHGGKHRSVALAELVAASLRNAGHTVTLNHLDL